ncbi:MAG TPA: site-specific integrase [Candidatus Binatia bacterium]|jgi:integrase|nr:site-specific integrase [Candidatus Binatia bacterium]
MTARAYGDGRVILRGSVYHYDFWLEGKNYRGSAKTGDRDAAERYLARERERAHKVDYLAPRTKTVTLETLREIVAADYKRKENKSLRRVAECYARLADVFSRVKATQITTERLERYTAGRIDEKAKPATINYELALLRRGFRLAVRNKRLPQAAIPFFPMLAVNNVRTGFIDAADFDALIAELRTKRPVIADACEFAYATLARRENTLGAQWTWFDLDIVKGQVVGGCVRIPGVETKNGSPLDIPLGPAVLPVIQRRWVERIPECPYVFHRQGKRITHFKQRWSAACEAIGFPGLLFHDFRRSGARNLRRAGVPETVIMAMGGWKTRAMFIRYGIVDTEELSDAQAQLATFLVAARAKGRKVVSARL